MPLDLEKANRERLIDYLKRKGESGLSSLRKEELLKMAKRAQRSAAKNHSSRSRSPHRSDRRNSGRKHRGGEETSHVKPSYTNTKLTITTLPAGDSSSWTTSGSTGIRKSTPYAAQTAAEKDASVTEQFEQAGGKNKKPRRKHKGGQQNSGATFLPARFFDPEAPLSTPNDANSIMTPYGQINAVSGSCRNLAPFPNPTNQQTGGKKKKTPRRKHKGGENESAEIQAEFQRFNANAEARAQAELEKENKVLTKEGHAKEILEIDNAIDAQEKRIAQKEIPRENEIEIDQSGGKKKKPATKKPATKKPTTKKPATKKPAPKKPAPKKPAAKKPATPKRKKSLWDKLMGLF